MQPKRIYLSPPLLEGKERQYLLEALESNWIAPTGPFVDRLEDALRSHTGLPGAVALNSGTSGIHLALKILGVGPLDEVICPTFTFIASAGPITYLGAKPVFVDCERDTWNMDPELLDQAIRARRAAGASVKAMIFAHCYGTPGYMNEILAVCNKHELPMIEDAAEALGSSYHGKAAGTMGHIGVYSFNGNKIVTGSVGGALVSNDIELCNRAKKLASQAKENTPHFEHHEVGFNYGMSNLVAAVVLGQLETLSQKVAHRRQVFQNYLKQFAPYQGVLWQQELLGVQANRWLSAFAFAPSCEIQVQTLRDTLSQRNAESRPLWKPLHTQKAFQNGLQVFGGALAQELFSNGICLPSLEDSLQLF